MNYLLRRSRIIVSVLAFALLGSCGAADPDERSTEPFGHVHGLGTNPTDGDLYVATHTGVFRLDGSPERIGPAQDTMGFTIAGPDKFLGSGHPATVADPPSLGLIESTDRAATWRPVAFDGVADFHAIDVSGPWTYAYAADQGLLRSRDNQTWETVTDASLYDIAANPKGPSRLLVTTDTGELQRVQVGTAPVAIPASPRMGPIDYAAPFLVAGLGPDGQVYVSRTGGETWTETSDLPGDSEAISTSTGPWFAATTEGIFRSTDEGVTWKNIYRVVR